MSRYTVIGAVWAQTSDSVEADSPEEAVEQANLSESLCWQCSERVELGEISHCIVLDALGEQVYSDEDRTLALRCATDEELAAEVARRKAVKP